MMRRRGSTPSTGSVPVDHGSSCSEDRSSTPCRARAATAAGSLFTISSSAMISSIMIGGCTPGTCFHEVTVFAVRSTRASKVLPVSRS